MRGHLRSFWHQAIDPRDLRQFARPSAPGQDQLKVLAFGFCVFTCFTLIFLQGLIAFHPNRPLSDYGSFYASGAWANLHVNPYRDHPLVNHIIDFDRHGWETPLEGWDIRAVNLNPPILLYPLRLLALLDPVTSRTVWTWISAAVFAISVGLILAIWPDPSLRIRLLWVLSLPAVWYTFQLGQIYTVLLLACTLAWWCLKRQKFLFAGIAIGVLCAIKPNFLIWPGLLILSKTRKTGITAITTALGLSAIPLFLPGPIIYRQWFAASAAYNGVELPGNCSLLAMFSRAGFPNMGLAATIVMFLLVAVWSLRAKPEPIQVSEVSILVSLLAGPLSWPGYTMLVIPILYGKSMNTAMRIGCALLCIPIWISAPIADWSHWAYVIAEAPSFYALLLIGIGAGSWQPSDLTASSDKLNCTVSGDALNTTGMFDRAPVAEVISSPAFE